MSNSIKGVHILIFPYPAQGHMLPMLDLTHQLALRGITITILVTPKNLPILNPLLSTHHPSSIQTLVLPFPSHPSLPSGVENIKDIGNAGNLPMINALGKLHDPIIHWFKSHPSPPVAILSDFFLGWTLHLAHQLGIPRIVFYSSGSFLASVSNFIWQNINTVRSLPVVHFPDLPRSPSFTADHLPSIYRVYRESDPDGEFLKDGMLANIASWGCVFNSLDALEGEYLDHLKKKMGHQRVWGVGPLSLAGGAKTIGRVNPDKDSGDRVLAWLDGCPDGLEKSGVKFIWCIKEPTKGHVEGQYGVIPCGFKDRAAKRGFLIRGWAPQVLILSHRAVGAFLTHCGWNSVLEGIMAGGMILAWPMEADQFVNARLLVEDVGAGVRVCEGADAVPDSTELAQTIANSMSGDTSVQKVRAKELKDKAVEAVKESGSSWRDLEGLVNELVQL
ncbi:UDP-glycosyltransferase 89B2-like [Camellia sinensis]|uniref:Glycosyltransferase n=1 Tax=Camellia sinensis var. sinensis TaxID=542762 RepID=A0A4S4EHV2_CAMSN|nr:UDP-glycosyltransferase 89B2-like [Camellia sinensis]THG15682.1 hypothetical protein TEA_021639 [Camellia sinensis var. sinensis]